MVHAYILGAVFTFSAAGNGIESLVYPSKELNYALLNSDCQVTQVMIPVKKGSFIKYVSEFSKRSYVDGRSVTCNLDEPELAHLIKPAVFEVQRPAEYFEVLRI